MNSREQGIDLMEAHFKEACTSESKVSTDILNKTIESILAYRQFISLSKYKMEVSYNKSYLKVTEDFKKGNNSRVW